jgi:hypothetical protein
MRYPATLRTLFDLILYLKQRGKSLRLDQIGTLPTSSTEKVMFKVTHWDAKYASEQEEILTWNSI